MLSLNPSNQKKVIHSIAELLVKKHHIKTIGKRDQSREMYIYKDGIYKSGFGFLQKEVQRILKNLANNSKKKEVIETIKDLTWTEISDFNPSKNLINFKNGVYNIKSKELLPHDPNNLFLSQIPINFNKEIDCPKIKKFLNEILDEDFVKTIQEWTGYILYRSYFIKKAIILVGGRDTGKTTLLRVIEKLLGKENFSGVNLQKISADRFSLSGLNNKYANIYDDLSFRDINDNGIFKMLTGGGTVTAEKKFGDQFQFENYAKLTFSCNKIPSVNDMDDEAYFSRWIIIRFEHKAEKLDKFLIDKITTEEEMSGLVNFALEGLERLLNNQDFSYQQTPEEIKLEMSLSGSSVAQFAHNQLEITADSNVFITKDDMYQSFINYVKLLSLPIVSKETLGKKLTKFIKISNAQKSIENKETGKMKQVACWLGVKFKNQNFLFSSNPNKEEVDELTDF